MSNAFEAVTQKLLEDQGLSEKEESASQDQTSEGQEENDSTESANTDGLSQEAKEAIFELKESGKFRYNGKDYTVKDFEDLQKGSLRMQDYTRKTQSLAEERKSFDGERKYYENLHADLAYVKANPNSVNQFLQTYPEKFHQYLKGLFDENTSQSGEQSRENSQSAYRPDFELLSKVNKLEKFYMDQEVSRAKTEISSVMEGLSKKYPDVLPKVALGDALELYGKGTKLTPEVWEEIYKSNDAMMKARDKQKYGEMVKKQVSANNKAKDVDAGGGTPGRAPFKPKRIEDIKDKMISDLSNR